MTSFTFTTRSNPEWNRKIEAGLRKEYEAHTGIEEAFKVHSIYVTNREVFVGGVMLEQHGDILWIDSFWIDLNFRRKGFGKSLLQQVYLFAAQNKTKEIQLNTYFEEAHDFFLICGFEVVGTIPNWKYGLVCYLMRKKV